MAALPGGDQLWVSQSTEPAAVDLYFFWSSRCPHCQEARPFIESLPGRYPWIRLHSLELENQIRNRERFLQMGRLIDITPTTVPTFMWCGRSQVGYADNESTGKYLVDELAGCYREYFGSLPPGVTQLSNQHSNQVDVPWFGNLDAEKLSLPALAVVLGGIDAFNPCAFFVLLFLLSLLVNTHSRPRMLLVGGVFVFTSGVVYFAFMAAWLNLFQLLGTVRLVTLAAGLLALLIGLLNVKAYYMPEKGAALAISQQNRERLFRRMRTLLDTQRLLPLLGGALLLALAANSYELLCTMGLPMVFTRILTLEQLPTLHYYGYLALYNLVYVLPLGLIVGLFVLTMGRRKLSQSEGLFLKLVSGLMMAGLGLLLLLAPDRLSHPVWAGLLVVLAVLVSILLHRLRVR